MARTATLERACSSDACPDASAERREFYIRPNGNPHSLCRPCFKGQAARRYQENRDAVRARQKAAYHRDVEGSRRRDRDRYPARRESMAAYLREWRKRNRARVNALQLKRDVLIRGAAAAELVDRVYVYERDGGRCHVCERKVPVGEFTLDHLVPVSLGGSHSHANVRVAHRSCNSTMGVCRLPAQLLLVA
jgi:5-methylcytosine-specific restriction endonuclease McrA